MLKKDLRKMFSQKRIFTTKEDLLNSSLAISNKLLQLDIWEYNNYHIYLSIKDKKEIDTTYILSILQGKDKNIILPKMEKENHLQNYLLTDNTKLKNNKWGVPEPINGIEISPKDIDVVFIPLLAYDTKGNRVGYGKGYYDNFLKQCKPSVLKVGLSIFNPVNTITDVYKTDVALDYCVTPKKIFKFKNL